MSALPFLPASLGLQVTTRDFNLLEMVSRAWGGEFSAPDHRVYAWGNGVRFFDSTDLGTTGIYSRGDFNILLDESGSDIDMETGLPIYTDP